MAQRKPTIVRNTGEGFDAALSALPLKSRGSRGGLGVAQGVEIVEDAGGIGGAYEP